MANLMFLLGLGAEWLQKDKRRYAAIEATKLEYGGVSYICRVLGCDNHTVARGQEELQSKLPEKEKNIRKSSGGRKSMRSLRILCK